ncbi:MAG TPA: sigma 54-interacting transcriptional regulator [Candidatus Hydrogenedens sp.]|nr:sigma 54-interacting transcriptional regulator [Candidatus Hydrogenedens sp.]
MSFSHNKQKSRFIITARSGFMRGNAWIVPDDSQLTMGRDPTCSIVIDDPLISRHHCQIFLSDDGLVIQDLGSSNSTFVNGHPVKEKVLQPGDDIGVGSIVFSVGTIIQKGNENGDETKKLRATRPIKIGAPVFVEGSPQNLFESGNPRTAEELAGLFSLARTLSQLLHVEDIINHVLKVIQERFNPDFFCLVQFVQDPIQYLVYPKNVTQSVLNSQTLFQMLPQIRETPRGVLYPERFYRNGETTIRNTVIAPVVLGKEVVGVFVMMAETPHRFYEESDLEYLLAMAHTLAPYLRAAERMQQLEWENQRLIAGGLSFDPLIGNSKAIQKVRALARDCAHSDLCVLILGETGTGKELVARLIHNLSYRAQKSLVVVNCAAIPEELFESELFGHEKGAFTGAHATKIGLMEEADSGTLFLDEVGDLSLSHQARLLRAIETGTFRRVGGNSDIRVNVRVLSATNKELPSEVNAGRFRRDLFHRLNAFVIPIPPLRERKDDIPLLADYFLQQAKKRFPVRATRFSTQALKWLESQPWPGNVRELRNLIERASVIAKGDEIQPQDLVSEVNVYTTEKFPTLEELEKSHIIQALQKTQGNVVSAAELLGIGKSTLYRKIADYQINPALYLNFQNDIK